MSRHDVDDDEYEEDTADSDDDSSDEREESFEQVEADYRRQRAVVRGCDDLDELRRMRGNLQAAVSAGRLSGSVRVRANDLIEIIDDRITDVKARRLAARRS